MSRLDAASTLLALTLVAACSPSSKPPETPETPAATADPDKAPAPAPSAEPSAEPEPEAAATHPAPPPDVPAGMALDTYEMTPSDCDALGRHYGEVARSDQMAQLSPKLSDKQRAATADQIDKVVGRLADKWTGSCQSALVDKAVDHGAIKCALAAKTVKDFDVCLNGPSGTPQPAGKKNKKK